jgi:hypothetical protein
MCEIHNAAFLGIGIFEGPLWRNARDSSGSKVTAGIFEIQPPARKSVD